VITPASTDKYANHTPACGGRNQGHPETDGIVLDDVLNTSDDRGSQKPTNRQKEEHLSNIEVFMPDVEINYDSDKREQT